MAVSADHKETLLSHLSGEAAASDDGVGSGGSSGDGDDGEEKFPLLINKQDGLDEQAPPLLLRHGTRRWSPRQMGAYIWAFVATVMVIILAMLLHQAQQTRYFPISTSAPLSWLDEHHGKRNLIFMVSDGMGPTSLSLTRTYRQYTEGLDNTTAMMLDAFVIGQSRTRSASSLITDSAAGATAFSCGKKTYNGAISTLSNHKPCGTVLEAAKKAGYMTGLVVTTRITDATPACFAAHVNKRSEEDRIAEQLLGDYPLGRVVDLMLGAGKCHFLANSSSGSCRADDKDLIADAKQAGFHYIDDRKGFDQLKHGRSVKLPLLGLFADQDIPYEIDRKHEPEKYPSLSEMANTALTALERATKHSEKGFFLMIEGSRIDHAGHANDPAAQVHEVLAYETAFETVLSFLDNSDSQGLLIATSDHETGGLATARQPEPYKYPAYRWFPEVLANANHSTSWLHRQYQQALSEHDLNTDHGKQELRTFLRRAISQNLGVQDVTDDEITELLEHPDYATWIFSKIISTRSETGWSTHGHSAADVNIYASNAKVAAKLAGGRENTQVGKFLATYLDVDVDAVTDELQRKTQQWDQKFPQGQGWMGKMPQHGDKMDGGSHLDRLKPDDKVDKRHEGCGCEFTH